MSTVRARWQLARDSLLLLAGIAIAAHETLIALEPRVSLLALACGMVGLPAALLADRRLVQAAPPPSPPSDSATP
jgi:hypothetical protein